MARKKFVTNIKYSIFPPEISYNTTTIDYVTEKDLNNFSEKIDQSLYRHSNKLTYGLEELMASIATKEIAFKEEIQRLKNEVQRLSKEIEKLKRPAVAEFEKEIKEMFDRQFERFNGKRDDSDK